MPGRFIPSPAALLREMAHEVWSGSRGSSHPRLFGPLWASFWRSGPATCTPGLPSPTPPGRSRPAVSATPSVGKDLGMLLLAPSPPGQEPGIAEQEQRKTDHDANDRSPPQQERHCRQNEAEGEHRPILASKEQRTT